MTIFPDRLQQIAELKRRVAELEEELLRVRTTSHAAAHHLDNIAIEQGFGAGLQPMVIADAVRRKVAELESDNARLHQALDDYGGHKPWCISHDERHDKSCTCGFYAASERTEVAARQRKEGGK